MRKVFWDTNALLDLIDQEREHHGDAIKLIHEIGDNQGICLCSWDSLSVIEYVGGKKFGKADIWEILRHIVKEFVIPKTGSEEALTAFQYLDNDFEEAMQIASAIAGKADCIVTRDKKGFTKSPIPVLAPIECSTLMS